jgi:hypothetical protein
MSEPINNLLSPDARRRLSNALMASQFDRPTPQDSPVTERAGMFPLATYANGQTGIAWPGFVAQPVESFANLLQRGYQGGTGDTQGVEDAFNVAGAAMLGGIAAPRPRGSIGMGGRPTDLDMSPEARKARAEAMGFDTSRVLYHGTGKHFDAFDPGTRGNGTKRNIYLTDNPAIAEIYANSENYGLRGGGNPQIIPVYAKSSKPLVVSDKGPDGSFGWVQDNLVKALGVSDPRAGKYATLYDEARRQGYDIVRIENMTDLGGVQTQYIPLAPSNIRSVNAAFDPEKASSANLLASNAGLPAAGVVNALLQNYYGDRQR